MHFAHLFVSLHAEDHTLMLDRKEDSDVDVCVEMKPNLFNRAGVKVYLEELLGCPVDVVRLRENMNQLFKQQILKYGVRVY